ncbi:MAG: dihydrolipoyl dehydrogenase family protein [Solirubrobacteraceae bacterium]
MPARRYDLIVVGMGSGGMVAAGFAASLGLRVACVERDRLGGDCLWTGCVPSKALLASARAAHTIRTADRFGLAAVAGPLDTARVLERIRRVQGTIAAGEDSPARFEALGCELHRGAARLAGPHAVEVDGRTLDGRFILLCTGSRPRVPDIPGLAEAGFLTSETVWDLPRLPASVIMIGAGPVAIELAQGVRRLGVAATVLGRGPRALARDEPELAAALVGILRAEGVTVESGVAVDRVDRIDRADRAGGEKVVHAGGRSWRAQELLIAAGRVPNLDGLGLAEVGIDAGPAGVSVDDGYRTAVRSVYAVGDLAGRHQFTHTAGFEAARAVRNMFIPGRARRAFTVPWTTFTDPELAHVGLTAKEARAADGGDRRIAVWRRGLGTSDRALAEEHADGAVMIVTDRGRVVGAHVLAPSAGELIGELALAVERRLRLTDLAGVVHVYPTIAVAIQQLAGEAAAAGARRYVWPRPRRTED